MKISKLDTYIKAVVVVRAEGYFVERLINLCKINNINVWDIKYVTNGIITFSISPKDYKRIKPFVKKSKCKVKIISRKGIYFDMFKYRKRRLAMYFLGFVFILVIVLSTFIWKINIYSDENIDKAKVQKLLNEINIKPLKNKLFISKGKISDYIRANMYEAAWVGVEIEGQSLNINIKSKIISKEEDKTSIGNIVATKSGVITKIIAENGTALYKTGSYIEKGKVAIEGTIKSEYMDDIKVHASGILNAIVNYSFEKEYTYKEKIKEKTDKKRYGIGIGINNKEFLIKYLPKDYKYDINKNAKNINIFGLNLSFIFNTYDEYILKDVVNTKEELIKKGEDESTLYFKSINTNNSTIVDKKVDIVETKDKLVYKVVLSVEEAIGEFVKTGD